MVMDEEPMVYAIDLEGPSSLMDLFSVNNPQAGKLYCIHCRQQLFSPDDNDEDESKDEIEDAHPVALRCSRCCVVHYCSQTCQRANFRLHKGRCKNIHTLRSTKKTHSAASAADRPSGTAAAETPDLVVVEERHKKQRYDLAYAIMDLAYLSTDTIDRGRQLYHAALVEYYELLHLDFRFVGVLESILILLTILGYDDHLLGLIDFVFYRIEQDGSPDYTSRSARRTIRCEDEDNLLLQWAQGAKPPKRKELWTDPTRATFLLKGEQWCVNNFLVPLLFVSIRQQAALLRLVPTTTPTTRNDIHNDNDYGYALSLCAKHSANLGRLIELVHARSKPILRALSPHSIQRWREGDAAELLALARFPDARGSRRTHTDNLRLAAMGTEPKPPQPMDDNTEHWKDSCLLFWELLKDTIAFTPKLDDALTITIDGMERYFGVTAVEEFDP